MFSRNANGVRAINAGLTFAPTPLALGLNNKASFVAAWSITRREVPSAGRVGNPGRDCKLKSAKCKLQSEETCIRADLFFAICNLQFAICIFHFALLLFSPHRACTNAVGSRARRHGASADSGNPCRFWLACRMACLFRGNLALCCRP